MARTGTREGASPGDWIDVSMPLASDMVTWPGDAAVRIERVASLDKGDGANVTRLEMGAHTGTHMDAPLHFLADGASIETMPLEATLGPCRVAAIDEDARSVEASHVDELRLGAGERVLFRTANSTRIWQDAGPRPPTAFDEDFVYLSTEAAHALVEAGVRCVGIDYLSVAGYQRNERAVHEALLGAGIWIVEGLDLSRVQAGLYEMACLPLKLLGADGAPARAALRPIKAHG